MSRVAVDLWAHQPVAVAAVADGLRGGGRVTVESACGTGKSRIGAAAAGVLAPAGRVLVTVPTLELAGQMLVTFAAHGGAGLGRTVAVCSDAEVVAAGELAELGLAGEAAVTTDPARLAALTAVPGRVTVLCTYQSLPVLAAAHARCGLPAWDLAVVDEAHRTAGRAGTAWAVIHDDVVIPAARRLYMTATLKILGAGDDELAVSMDDPKVYGPVVFRLPASEGIRRGLLADYQLLVPVVTDADVRALAQADDQQLHVGGVAVSPRMLATQIAVLRATHEYGVRRAITYHHRVADARAWAELLPRASQILPSRQRPAAVSAYHVYGGQPAAQRRQILNRLRAGTGDDDGIRVVCNARVLTEGVDAPAVDGIVLVDPRNSVIDTVQAVGRALRTGGNPGKIAKIIIPVFCDPDEDPESVLAGSAYAQVWQVIRALRATDDRLSAYLDTARARLGARRLAPGGGAGPEEPGGWLRVCGTDVPAGFAAAIQLRAVQEASSSWVEYYGAARAFYQVHGHLDLPVSYTAPGGLKVGEWLRNQRRYRRRLPADRAALLDQIGMIWDSHADQAWQATIAAARDWAASHDGSLRNIPSGSALSRRLIRQRRELHNGRLPAYRKAQLDAIDPAWHQSSDDIWDQHYQAACAFAAEYHHLRPAPGWRTPDGLDLPGWLDRQRSSLQTGELHPGRKRLLDAIGMPWSLAEDDWQRGIAAARDWAAAHGNLNVPAGFVTQDGFEFGKWLAGRRRSDRRGLLLPDHREAFEALDPGWQTTRSRADRWAVNYAAARAYAARHGRLPTGRGAARDPAPQGTDFRPWLRQQRQLDRHGKLPPDRGRALDDLDPDWRGTTQPAPPASRPAADDRTRPGKQRAPRARSSAVL